MDVISHKDVVLAVFGAEAALAGLLLVFQGFILSAYTGLPAVTPQSRKAWFKWATAATTVSLLVSLGAISWSLVWLNRQEGYAGVLALFWLTLAAIAVLGTVVSWKLVK